MKKYQLEEFIRITGLEESEILEYVRKEWIDPCETNDLCFDEEDQARIQLICDLRERFEVNDEGVDVILHLVDQIHYLRARIGDLGSETESE